MKFAMWLNEAEQNMPLPNTREFAYLGCVLEKISQTHLIGLARKHYNEQNNREMPRDWVVRAHHMTVKFGPSAQDLQNYHSLLGQTVELSIRGFASDANCCAVLVAPNMNIRVENASPHITIAHAMGVKPVYSNQLLMNKDRIMPIHDSVSLVSIFLAVKHNQTQVWPEVGYALASPSLNA